MPCLAASQLLVRVAVVVRSLCDSHGPYTHLLNRVPLSLASHCNQQRRTAVAGRLRQPKARGERAPTAGCACASLARHVWLMRRQGPALIATALQWWVQHAKCAASSMLSAPGRRWQLFMALLHSRRLRQTIGLPAATVSSRAGQSSPYRSSAGVQMLLLGSMLVVVSSPGHLAAAAPV